MYVCVVRRLKNKELADSVHDSNRLALQLLSSSPDLLVSQHTRDGPSDGEHADADILPFARLFTGSCRRERQRDKVQSNVMKELPGVLVLVLGLHISDLQRETARWPRVSVLKPALTTGV